MKVTKKTLRKVAKFALVAMLASSLALVGCKGDDDDDDDNGSPVSPSGKSDTPTPTPTPSGSEQLSLLDFEGVSDATTVAKSTNAAECLEMGNDRTTYVKFDNNQTRGSDRSMFLLNALDKVPTDGSAYTIEFDAMLRGRHGKKRFSQLAILTDVAYTAKDADGNDVVTEAPDVNGKTANVIYRDKFLMTLTCGSALGGIGGNWKINVIADNDSDNNLVEGPDGSVDITNEAWNHYTVTVDGTKVTLAISGTDTLATKTLTLPATTTGGAKWIYFNGAGYSADGGGMICIDNVKVSKITK